MTLIEMVRATRKNGHRYCAVDKNGSAMSYLKRPHHDDDVFIGTANFFLPIGHYNLTCNWKDSLIDITKLRGIK